MKKILFIIPKLATGGTNSSLESLYLQLKDKYEISVFSLSHHPISHNYSFCKVLLPKDYFLSLIYANFSDQKGINKVIAFFVKFLRTVMKFLGSDLGQRRSKYVVARLEKKYSYDYVVAYQEGNATHFAALFKNPNKLAWIHVDYSKYLQSGTSEEAIYSAFSKVISVSEYTTSVFKQRYPSLSGNAIAIHNLIDPSRVIALSKEKIDDERFIADKFTILSVGRFAKIKRFSEVPRIASILKVMGVKFKWYILGPSYQLSEVEEFQTNMKKYGVDDSVEWLGGKANPYPYFAAANLYVCLSESEACPMVFKEARILGLPIVSTDFPSAYEFIDQNSGIISDLQDVPTAIVSVKQQIDQGFCVEYSEHDNHILLDKICKLF